MRDSWQFLVSLHYGRHARVLLSNGPEPVYGRGLWHGWSVLSAPIPGLTGFPVVVPEVVNPGRSAHARGEES